MLFVHHAVLRVMVALLVVAGAAVVGQGTAQSTAQSSVQSQAQAHGSARAADEVGIGVVKAQLGNLHAPPYDGSNQCLRYWPKFGEGATQRASALVAAPGEAQTAHGYQETCPPVLDLTQQSGLGFAPVASSDTTVVPDGAPVSLGKVTRYDHAAAPGSAALGAGFTADLTIAFAGFDEGADRAQIGLELRQSRDDEGPCANGGVRGPAGCPDELDLRRRWVTQPILRDGEHSYRLIPEGTTPVAADGTCPATPAGPLQVTMLTTKDVNTSACFYGSLRVVRSLTVAVEIVPSPDRAPESRIFGGTSSSGLRGSPWTAKYWSVPMPELVPVTRELVEGERVVLYQGESLETNGWKLTGLRCEGEDGAPVPEATYQVELSRILFRADEVRGGRGDVTCTFTNTDTFRGGAELTLVKNVLGGDAQPSDFRLAAIPLAPDAQDAGAHDAGAHDAGAHDAGIRSQSGEPHPLAPGTYRLVEADVLGYDQTGNWSCVGASTDGSDGTVKIDQGQQVICTVTNTYVGTGTVQLRMNFVDPHGGVGPGVSVFSSGWVRCDDGFMARFDFTSTVPDTVEVEAGQRCEVTQDEPSQHTLRNRNYRWAPLTYSPSRIVETTAGAVQTVTITNRVEPVPASRPDVPPPPG